MYEYLLFIFFLPKKEGTQKRANKIVRPVSLLYIHFLLKKTHYSESQISDESSSEAH